MSDIEPTAPPSDTPTILPGRGWKWHLTILCAYPLVLGPLGFLFADYTPAAALSPETWILLTTVAYELTIFALVFAVACRASRVSTTQLYLPWRGGVLPVFRGAGYSLALRILVGMITVALVLVYALFHGVDMEALQRLRPKVEVVVDPAAMASNPVYLWLNLTVISFIVAGLREELWRAGMLAAMQALWPARFSTRLGGFAAAAIIAVAFGVGHLPQGWGAVGMTAILGFGLGAIMVWHRSLWDAVFAHGFFNATSFAMLYYIARHHPGLLTGS